MTHDLADRTLVLAVDGGQTSSRAIVATTSGDILAWGTGPACDHLHGPNGYERNRAAIHESARMAIAAAGVREERIGIVGLGLTSAPRESPMLHLFTEIVHEMLQPFVIWLDTDYVSNLAGASGNRPGVVVIAGGGSIAYGIDREGNEAVAGGLGYLMGDDGSAWYIGLCALQAAARVEDRRATASALLPLVLEHYGLASIRQIGDILYRDGFTRDEVSLIAPKVARLASEGDATAREIVTNAGRLLGETAVGVLRQLNLHAAPVPVYPTGGVFKAGEPVLGPFRAAIAASQAAARVAGARLPPVIGAYLKALERAGIPVTGDVLARLDTSLAKHRGAE